MIEGSRTDEIKPDSLFYAKVVDASGNHLSAGNLVFSPQKSPLARKSYAISSNGIVSFSQSCFGGEAYWGSIGFCRGQH